MDSTYCFESEIIAACDVLMRCDTPSKAAAYVVGTLSNATAEMKERCLRAYFGTSLMRLQAMRRRHDDIAAHKGGVDTDPRILRMLAAADTFHDFKNVSCINRLVDMPKQISKQTLARERELIERLSRIKHLNFTSEKVCNPFYRIGILKTFDLDGAILNSSPQSSSADADVKDIYKKQLKHAWSSISNPRRVRSSFHVDIMTTMMESDGKTEALKLCQVCQLLCSMHRSFAADAEFVVDSSGHPLLTLIVSMKNVDASFFWMFTTVPTHSCLAGVSSELIALCKETLRDDEYSNSWKAVACDATLFDSATNSIPFDLDQMPTGDVYDMDAFGYQVTLLGARSTENGRMFSLKVADDRKNEYIFDEMTNKQASKHFSINHLAASTLPESPRKNAKTAKKSSKIDRMLAEMDDETRFAIKRAGDWGQVRNCLLRNRVFVTRDKLAAMYAHLNNVDYMFMAYEQKCDAPLPGALPRLFRYSWTVCPRGRW